MTKDTRAEENAEPLKQQEPLPSLEQTKPESESAEEAPQPEKVEEAKPEESESDYQLPEEAKERTKEQFDKLKQANKKLKEQLEEKKVVEKPVYKPQYQIPRQGVDQGSLAWEKLQQMEERQTYEKYPALNPNEEGFNQELSKEVEARLLHSYVNPQKYGGRELSFLEAADLVKNRDGKNVEKAKKDGAKTALEELTPKEQASLEATGRSDRRSSTTNLGDLQQKSREGDNVAIMKRLQNSKL